MAEPDKLLLKVLRQERQSPPPIWLMRQAGRYLPEYRALRAKASDFLQFCYSPELASEATLQPIERFDFDAAIVFSDILVVPHALGRNVEFREGEGPVLEPLRHDDALPELQVESFVAHLAPVYETIRRVRASLAQQKTLIGFAGAPWTLACYMVQGRGRDAASEAGRFAGAVAWAEADVERFDGLIELLCDAIVLHAGRQIEAGAEVIQLFDSWAGQLPPGRLARWSVQPLVRAAEGIHAQYPNVPVIAFPRQTGARSLDYALSGAFQGLSIDASVSLDFAAARLQKQLAVQGNLDPQALVEGGGALERAATRILTALDHGPFIFNLGHGVLPQTPPANVARLVELVRQWRGL